MKRSILPALIALALAADCATAQEREPYRSPEAAALRSIVLPGWGQWSNGDDVKGTSAFAAAAFGIAIATRTIALGSTPRWREAWRGFGWSLYGLSIVLSSTEAYRRASALNRDNGYDISRLRVLDDGKSLALGVVLYRHGFGGP